MTKYDTGKTALKAIQRREFLQYAGSGAVVGAVGLGTAGWAQSQPQSRSKWRKADRSKLAEYPILSLKERDRRWGIARRIMQENKVEGLVVPGVGSEGGPDNWFTNDVNSTVFFPLDREPVALASGRTFQAGAWLQNEERGEVPWVKDWRFDSTPADILKDLGLASARIGTLGVYAVSWATRNSASRMLVEAIQKDLPRITWVELWEPFVVEWLTKSEEELAVFRKAALMVEVSFEDALEMTKPGVTETDIYSTIICSINRAGGRISGMNFHSGTDNVGWANPKWTYRAQKPRVIQSGDIINIEIGPSYGHLSAQGQLAMAVGKAADINYKLAEAAREAYGICLKMTKPGIKFRDLAEAMSEPNRRGGFWHMTPLIHSLNPLECVSPITEGVKNFKALVERFPHTSDLPGYGLDIVLREGMCFQPEPNASLGRTRVNIGGNVVVTKTGCVELNQVCTEMRQV